ncbi:MAG TPA: hypothetical protein VKU84_05125 [Stellaceae bacterium]|nr:hypothetical protein [Stellaceae bacterium]
MSPKLATGIGTAISGIVLGLIHVLPPDKYKMADNIMGVIFLTFLVGGGAWVAFWWRRIRRMRAKKSN